MLKNIIRDVTMIKKSMHCPTAIASKDILLPVRNFATEQGRLQLLSYVTGLYVSAIHCQRCC